MEPSDQGNSTETGRSHRYYAIQQQWVTQSIIDELV